MATRSWAHTGMTNVKSRLTGHMDAWLLRSTDAGRTWSKPQNMTSQLWTDSQHMPTPSNGHGIQTSSGRLIMPTYVRPGGSTTQNSAVIYSDDGGST